jgi:hypothetical protein
MMNMHVPHTPLQFVARTMIILLFAATGSSSIAQQNEKIHFQITVRDYNGNLLSNQELGIRVRVLSNDMDIVFEEVHQLQTSATGIASIDIGSGSSQSGNLDEMGKYLRDEIMYIRTDIDPAGGTNYKIVSHNRISSVPYALRAKYVIEMEEEDPTYLGSVAGGLNKGILDRWEYAARAQHYPGDRISEGIVFYVDSTGESGLMAASHDLAGEVSWMDAPTDLNNTESFVNGAANTASILQQSGASATAAYYCDTLTLNGKDDWYLPAIDELLLLNDARYQFNRAAGEDEDPVSAGLTADRYWSSTEASATESWLFDLGKIAKENKSGNASVRAVRKFSGMYDVHNYPWLLLLGPEEESKSNGNVSEIVENENGDVIVDEAGKRGTVCRTTPGICLPAKITFKLQTEYNPGASEPPTILRGTGDFRICFGGPPKGETLENISEANMGEFEGVQFRIHPHLDESVIRVYTGSEPHTCTSIWLRYVNPDKQLDSNGNPITGLASDECQGRGNHCGWERVGLFEDGFGLDNMEEALVTVIISEAIISISVKNRTWSIDINDLKENDDDIVGDVLRFDQVTFMSISHTNTSRGYRTIKISDLKVLPIE